MASPKLLLLIILLFGLQAKSQRNDGNLLVGNGLQHLPKAKQHYYIVLHGSKIFELEHLEKRAVGPNTFQIKAGREELLKLLETNEVKYLQNATRQPKVEARLRQHNFQVNEISYAQSNYPLVKGNGIRVSIKENKYNTGDFDIEGRALEDNFSSSAVALHATEMATLVAGAGNTYLTGLGVVPEATLYSADFSNLLPEPESYYGGNEISVQNHSYGVGIEAFYGVESVAYDATTLSHPNLIHSFSIGNSGTSKGGGQYGSVDSYGTITGSFKQAKNVILSSSSDSLGAISGLNSRGPAFDGRLKPDLVAFGGEGTSESAALVSGAAAFLQDAFLQEKGILPNSDLIRSILIAGADDILANGPDFISGFGELNLQQSADVLASEWHFHGEVTQASEETVSITLPPNTKSIRIVLVWNDPPAEAGAEAALVNDLDLSVDDMGTQYLPWVLDSSPNLAALQAPATRGVDRLNNVELVTIEDPVSENLQIKVQGFQVNETQPYAIAYFLTRENRFEVTYPTRKDPVESGKPLTFYWSSNISSGTMEVSFDQGVWETAPLSESLSRGKSKLAIHTNATQGQIRLVTPDAIYYSEVFSISPNPDLGVELDCEDELVLTCQDVGADSYVLQEYREGVLVSIKEGTDTVFQVDRSNFSGNSYRILPVRSGEQLLPSFLVNVDQQNAGCYINNFLVSTAFRQVELVVSLSGVSQISTIKLLKSNNGKAYLPFLTLPAAVQQSVVDDSPAEGFTSYLLEVETAAGAIYQEERNVYFASDKPVIFPTVAYEGFINLVSPESSGRMEIYNNQGYLVVSRRMSSEVSFLNVSAFASGIYHFVIQNQDSKTLKQGKFIVP